MSGRHGGDRPKSGRRVIPQPWEWGNVFGASVIRAYTIL